LPVTSGHVQLFTSDPALLTFNSTNQKSLANNNGLQRSVF